MRRIVAAVLMLVLANVSVARALACEGSAPRAEQTLPHGTGHEHHSPSSQAPETPEAPLAAQCCQAMASCVATGVVTIEHRVVETPPVSAAVAGALLAAPLTRSLAPEPPPPKA